MKKLGFGLMRLPLLKPDDQTSFDMDQVCRMVDHFLEEGFTYFDTAYMYHDSKSEELLREALVKRHPRESFTVATKLPVWFMKKQEDQERIFSEQLERCGVSYFDYYLLHNMTQEHYKLAQQYDSFSFVSRLKEAGKIRKMGFSFHDKADLLDRILTEHPEVDFVQLQINYLDWDSEDVQSRKCYEVAVKHGKSVVVMEPVKGGTLANLPSSAAELLREAEPDASAASWAIRFAASLENTMVVLSGMSTFQQLVDNTRYMKDFKPLTEAEYSVLDRVVSILKNPNLVPCTACRYCVSGCPKKIAIPEYFSLYNRVQQDASEKEHAQNIYDQTAAAGYGKASDCIACKKCEKSCPQHIEISSRLKDVAGLFEE